MDTKIVEKIKKLLALSESSNEYEAKVAMLKVQELLVKYKLSMKEVKDYKICSSKVLTKKTKISFTSAKWKGRLASLIADNFSCYCYYKIKRTNIITFLGREEDVTVCNIVLEYAIDCIASETNRIKYQYRRDGYSTVGIVSDYAIGFISGLNDKFEEQKRKNQEWGIILAKDTEVTEQYENIDFNRSINLNQKFKGNSDVLEQGIEDGRKFSISDKVEQGKSGEIDLLM
ncbi:hypothetical protein J2Z42_001416 [Clostridium algifaecis]|uniref:DUF2786 domain-containing protein n=1 Tax=Clostridium algifaecis TaxID=1472040 RepID=A0ABS4KRT6_9CLOT|nr:hypothetical protein [Clostridium algifaecis]